MSVMPRERNLPTQLTYVTKWAADGERCHAKHDGYEGLGMHGVGLEVI